MPVALTTSLLSEKRILHLATIDTPVGLMKAIASPAGVVMLEFGDTPARVQRLMNKLNAADLINAEIDHLAQLRSELAQYFAGSLTTFKTPVNPIGTPFQLKAWDALCTIPFGQTRSYAAQARSIHQPTATRAVGMANGQNAIAIVIPCHRVIGAVGTLTGYGGGLDRKRWLINFESSRLF